MSGWVGGWVRFGVGAVFFCRGTGGEPVGLGRNMCVPVSSGVEVFSDFVFWFEAPLVRSGDVVCCRASRVWVQRLHVCLVDYLLLLHSIDE